MPSSTTNDQSPNHSQHPQPLQQKISRDRVIDLGMSYLHEIGADHICKVCISRGGSCCSGCLHLTNGIGCTLRNTSCTAWLCGFLKYVLYETGSLQQWYDFWDQVPGKDFRADTTPDDFFIDNPLQVQTLTKLSEALALDLKDIARAQIAVGFIFTLREKLDKNLDQFIHHKEDRVKRSRLKSRIAFLSKEFHHFHRALQEHRQPK